jgi:RHS repeat-associated protein
VKESVRDALTGELVVRTVNYGYDDLYRLSSETVLDAAGTVTRQVNYTYDDVGNRTVLSDSAAGTTAYLYDKNDRLLSETGATNVTYTYDNNGNTKSVTQGGQTTTYTWDNRNRMTQVQSPTGTTVYTYDDENMRTSSRVGTQTTQFLLDGNRDYSQVLAEARNGTVQASYVYGLDLVSQKRGGTESFYLVDGLGSTRGLTNATGGLTDSYTYDAFGTLVGSAGTTTNNYLFAGEQYDSNLDQYYLRQRFYDAGTGRFTRKDTYEGNTFSPITLNKYVYGNGNPVKYTDPTGLFSIGEANAAVSISNILDSIQLDGGHNFLATTLGDSSFPDGNPISDEYYILSSAGGLDLNQGVIEWLENYAPHDYVIRFLVYGGALPIPKKLLGLPTLPGTSKLTNPISFLGLKYFRGTRLPQRVFGSPSAARAVGRANVILATGLLIYDTFSLASSLKNNK